MTSPAPLSSVVSAVRAPAPKILIQPAPALAALGCSSSSEAVATAPPEPAAPGPGLVVGKVPVDPPTRSFPSFSAAAAECGLSRVYLGIHFRHDSVEGTKLGRRTGEYAVEGFLRPIGDGGAGG